MSSSHGHQVPVARRLLAARPVRTGAGVLGIGLALVLMLLLNGLWTGVQEQVTVYDDHLGADLVVVPPGTDSLFADPGIVPLAAVGQIERVPDVTRTWPIRTMYLILELPDGKAAVAAVASEPGGAGGPWAFAEGRAPVTAEEVVLDALFADGQDLGVGDRLDMFGHAMKVVGLSEGTAMFMTPLLFVTNDAMTGMLGAADTTGAVLVSTTSPEVVAQRLRDEGLSVRTPAQLREASLSVATQIYGSPVRLMVAVAFAAGTLITALVVYTGITEQQRDLGVLKALGATPGRIRRLAVAETAALTVAGALAAVLLLLLARELLGWWRPAFPIALTPATAGRTAVTAAAMATLAAWLPARRVNRLDAATVFRSR
ncbi:ABC transporter permease [uncultured Serinicoccus sp.]|uniref:ABC transporter permease n=1 Tax=uncultured Serinicoccus sp. TaxID=735514 RepID=UPI0026155675|nr:ABC transporter permease [uncultured Serinicoccus sp.]